MTEPRDPEFMFLETAWRLLRNLDEAQMTRCLRWLTEKTAAEIKVKHSKIAEQISDIDARLEKWKQDEPQKDLEHEP